MLSNSCYSVLAAVLIAWLTMVFPREVGKLLVGTGTCM